MTLCSGCGKVFSFIGYAKHLAQTTNMPCKKIYGELLGFESSNLDPGHEAVCLRDPSSSHQLLHWKSKQRWEDH
jgi:hypothetical protein